nr:alpha/beta fold hydrolase [Idiomarina xiamenensis]
MQQYVDDAIAVAKLLTARFDTDKVILMGHSWGTIVAMHAALKRPDLFSAYVGIGQVIDVHENERISFNYVLQQAKAVGNQAAVEEMMTIAPYLGDQPLTRERIVTARKWAQHYGGLSAYRDNSFYYYRAPVSRPSTATPSVARVTPAISLP